MDDEKIKNLRILLQVILIISLVITIFSISLLFWHPGFISTTSDLLRLIIIVNSVVMVVVVVLFNSLLEILLKNARNSSEINEEVKNLAPNINQGIAHLTVSIDKLKDSYKDLKTSLCLTDAEKSFQRKSKFPPDVENLIKQNEWLRAHETLSLFREQYPDDKNYPLLEANLKGYFLNDLMSKEATVDFWQNNQEELARIYREAFTSKDVLDTISHVFTSALNELKKNKEAAKARLELENFRKLFPEVSVSEDSQVKEDSQSVDRKTMLVKVFYEHLQSDDLEGASKVLTNLAKLFPEGEVIEGFRRAYQEGEKRFKEKLLTDIKVGRQEKNWPKVLEKTEEFIKQFPGDPLAKKAIASLHELKIKSGICPKCNGKLDPSTRKCPKCDAA